MKSAKLNGLTGVLIPAEAIAGGVDSLEGVKDVEVLRVVEAPRSWLVSVFGLSVGNFMHGQPHPFLSSISTAPKRQPFLLLILSRISRTSLCSVGLVRTLAAIAKQRIATIATPLSAVWATMPQTWYAWCNCKARNLSEDVKDSVGCVCKRMQWAVWNRSCPIVASR